MAVNHTDVVGRYLNLFDRLPEKGSVIDDLVALFAPDAVIRLFEGQEPIEGRGAIRQVYADFAEALVENKHVWKLVEVSEEESILEWLQAARMSDGRLLAHAGIERVHVNNDGLIISLDNRMVTPDSDF